MDRSEIIDSVRRLDNDDRLNEALAVVEAALLPSPEDEEIIGQGLPFATIGTLRYLPQILSRRRSIDVSSMVVASVGQTLVGFEPIALHPVPAPLA